MAYKRKYQVVLNSGTAPFTYDWQIECNSGAISFLSPTNEQSVIVDFDPDKVIDNAGCDLLCITTDADGSVGRFVFPINVHDTVKLKGSAVQVSAALEEHQFNVLGQIARGVGTLDFDTIEVTPGAGFLGTYEIDTVNGIITYTAPASLPGTETVDTLYIEVRDIRNNLTNQVPFIIVLYPTKNAPVSFDDTYATDYMTPITFNPLDNDVNAQAFNILTMPSNGTVTVDGNEITYTPNEDFDGDDTLTYQAINVEGLVSSSTTVTISVAASTLDPVPTVNITSLTHNGTDTLSVVATVTDVESIAGIYLRINNILQSPTLYNYDAVTDTLTGDFTVTADGTYVIAIQGSNFTGSSVDTSVFVLANNQPPLAGDLNFSTLINIPKTINLLQNTVDPEGDSLTITHISGTPKAIGEDRATPNGMVTLDSANTITYAPNTDYTGSDAFTFTVSDGTNSDVGNCNVTVNTGCPGFVSLSYEHVAPNYEITVDMTNISAPTITWSEWNGSSYDLMPGETSAVLVVPETGGQYQVEVWENNCQYSLSIIVPPAP